MNPRQARRERREAERKAKKLDLKKSRLPGHLPLSKPSPESLIAENDPRIQPRWNPDLEDEFPREEQIRNNAIADRMSLQFGRAIPPPGPSPRLNDYLVRKEAIDGAKSASKTEAGFVSQNHPAPLSRRAAANRANAELSTGPRTPEGKLASSRNSTKHGLASGTLIIPGEDHVAFENLLNDLLAEHQPANPTEDLLIQEMAQSFWLSQRAIRLQNDCFTAEGVNEKQLALFLRYQTTHERRFYKALNCLMQLRKEAARNHPGFVSQYPATDHRPDCRFARQSHPTDGFVSQTPPPPRKNSREETTPQAA